MNTLWAAFGIASVAVIGTVSALGCNDNETSSNSPRSTSSSTGGTGSESGNGGNNNNNNGGGGDASSGNGEGAGGGGGGGNAESEYMQFCEAAYEHNKQCGEPDAEMEFETCQKSESCALAFYRKDVLPLLHECILGHGCLTGNDCAEEVADTQSATPVATAYADHCKTRQTECKTDGMPFWDDLCYNVELINDAVLNEMDACLTEPCGDISDCLGDVVDTYEEPCDG